MNRAKRRAHLTEADLEAVRGLIRDDLDAQTGTILSGFKSELTEKIDEVRGELKTDFFRLDSRFNGLAGELVRTNGRMRDMEDRLVVRMDVKFGDIAGRLDAFSRQLETFFRESCTLPKTLDEHGKTLHDHESRIRSLESGFGQPR